MGYYSAMKRYKLLINAIVCMNLDGIIISERRQTQKATFIMVTLFNMLEKAK